MIQRARRVILLADAAKFRPRDFARISSWQDVDGLVTDEPVPMEATPALDHAEVEVVVAKEDRNTRKLEGGNTAHGEKPARIGHWDVRGGYSHSAG